MDVFSPIRAARTTIGSIDWRSRRTWVVIVVAGIIAVALIRALSGSETETPTLDRTRSVTLGLVSALSSDTSPLPVVGEVTASTESDLRAEAGGRVTGVYAKLGENVRAGAIIAETENSSQRAALLQSEGVLDGAKAALAKVRGGTRSEQLAILDASLDSAEGAALTTLLSAYAAADTAIRDTADELFTGIEIGQISFRLPTSDQQTELALESQRARLSGVLARHDQVSRTASKDMDLESELTNTEAEIREVRTFVDTLIAALDNAIPSDTADAADIAGYRGSAATARASLTSSLSAVSSARSSLAIAKQNVEQGVSGAQDEDVLAAEAAVKQAQGAYNAALASLERTRIRTSISGTVANLSVSRGDFVAPQQRVGIVTNTGALEIIAYVSDGDRASVIPGTSALIDGRYAGTITRVAPTIDPVTRKVEIRIGFNGDTPLTSGASVRIEISRSSKDTTQDETGILIPISAVKIEADRTIAFTVENGVLVAHTVTLGEIRGDSVEIRAGLGADWYIVTDARGLKEGQSVVVAE